MKVAIFFGGKSDTDVMKGTANCLRKFRVEFRAYVLSAHRVPEELAETLKEAEGNRCEVVIAEAGPAAHLPGIIASQAAMPVIGVPIEGAVGGLDALFSITQTPKSIPVATVGINNNYSAGILTVQVLTIKDSSLRERLDKFRLDMKSKFIEENGNEVEL